MYWESACALILVNARHIKQVPGRKTDKADCAWIASPLRHGLLQPSFIPEREARELRDLCRMRTTLVRDAVRVGNRLRKVLEDANIKLDSVASDALGVSGMEMIRALASGVEDPAQLAQLARGRLRAKIPQLEQALAGQVTRHHRFLLNALLKQLTFLDEQIAHLEQEIERHMPPFEWAATLLATLPGVERTAACALIAEIGADMTRFPTLRHLASWAGLCPGNHESAGKKRSGKSHRGNRWIRPANRDRLGDAADQEQLQRRPISPASGPRGKKRALVAVGNSLLQAAWHVLTHRQNYRDLGADFFDRLNQREVERILIRRLEKLGHKVTLEPVA